MEGSLRQIPLSELGDTIGTPPSQRLKDSVKRMGIIQPVILTEQADESGEIHLAIVDGNRRVAAARAAGMEQIPAVVFEGLEPNTIAETTLASNSFRTSNYLAEFWALKQLERNQYQYNDIVAASGMASSTLKLRNSLSGLHRDLFVALRNGQINQTEATAAAKLPRHQQDALAETFRRTGKLTRRDIQAFAPPDSKTKQTGDKVADQLAAAAIDAAKVGYSKAEFLEMAGRIWDTSVHDTNAQSDQDRDEQVMSDQAPVEPFPDLAAHKWDTGES